MADSLALVANGSTFQRGDSGSPEVFTDLAEISDIVPGNPSAPTVDVSHLKSAAREKRGGLPDTGTMTVTGNLLPGNAAQEAMEDEAGTNVVRNYRIMFPAPHTTKGRQYALVLTAFGLTGFVVDGKIQFVSTFEISGKPTRVG